MKDLGFYKFAPALLESWEDFYRYDFLEKIENGKPLLTFKWSFREYAGCGEIYYHSDTRQVRNAMDDNYSILHLTKPEMQEAWGKGLKHYSPLYNEPGLEEVFNRILDEYFER